MDRLRPAVAKPNGRLALWYDLDKKWGNQTTEECYNRIRFLKNQQMGGNVPNYALAGERPLPILDAQPPLPNAGPIRLFEHEDEDNQEKALVSVMPYVNETQYGQPEERQEWMRNPPVTFFESQYSMDLKTLMFIANQARLPTAQGPKKAPNLPLGPCYNCSWDHLIKDCLYQGNLDQTLVIICMHWLDIVWNVASNTWCLIDQLIQTTKQKQH